jgi:predicted DNA-binding transcriptional regulator YafY
MEKKNRILAILYRLYSGNEVSVTELSEEYQVARKSISRDISIIRSFLAEHRELVGNVELLYDRKKHSYVLSAGGGIQAKELLIILKILLGSRVFGKDELRKMTANLTVYSSHADQKLFRDFWKNEMEYYCPVNTESSLDLYDTVWRLEEWIKEGKSLEITYKKLNGKRVERWIYPIAVTFSSFYFYLLACRGDMENSAVIYYRMDRIAEIHERKERIPIEIEERRRLEKAKVYNQKMFMGRPMKIRFLYTGPSVEAVLDKFPTASVVRQHGEAAEITAMVEYSRGTIMELLSQGRWVKVLGPKELVDDMQIEIRAMKEMYGKKP